MSGPMAGGLARRLLRVGRDSGRRSEAARIRYAALAFSAFAVALCLGVLVMVHAAYTGKEERREARTPAWQSGQLNGKPATMWLVGTDALKDQRRFSVVFLAPRSTDAPLPPGVKRWPGPGEAVLSPGLLKAGAAERIAGRYGKLAGTIGQEGLDDPGEWLAYVRPAAGLKPQAPVESVVGFGPQPGTEQAEGLAPGMARDDDKSEGMFRAVVVGLLLLPSLVLLFIALRTGAHSRDRRSALVDALGGRRRDRALIAIGEVIRPVTWGAFASIPVFAVAMAQDIKVPYVGYLLSSADVRQHGWTALLAPVGSIVVALALAVVSDRVLSPATGTRPRRIHGSRRQLRIAMACPFAILLATRGPQLTGENTELRTWISGLGIAAVVLTLPSAVAVVVARLGAVLERTGRERGWAGTLIAGRRMIRHPAATARLVTGVVVGLIVFAQVLAWQGIFATYNAQVERSLSTTSRQVAEIGPRETVTAEDTAAFLRLLPAGNVPVLLTSAEKASEPVGIRGDCPALESLRLPCPRTRTRVDLVLDHRLQTLLQWNTKGGTYLEVVRADRAEVAKQAVTSGSTLAVVKADGGRPAVPALKEASYAAYPRGAQVRFPGEEWVADSMPDRDQGRWIRFFGVLGMGLLVLALGLSGKAEFLRQGRALGPLTVLTGGHRVFRSSAAWAIIAPLGAAGVAGSVIAAWLARPVSRPGITYFVPMGLMAAAVGVVLAVSVLMWWWAAGIASKQARNWQP
ncbi:ABC transporter permease [Streptomyces sp. NPDC093591]|uniref:ABC transporter permease n=1 Tax=Streptomyces sp. NPDC093591 TaxID=3366044 RepID=UPI0038054FC1